MLESSKGCHQRALERKRKLVSIPNMQKGLCEQKPWSASTLGGSPTCCLTEIPALAWMQELEEEMRVPGRTPYAALQTDQLHPLTASPEVFGQERWLPPGFLVSTWPCPRCLLGDQRPVSPEVVFYDPVFLDPSQHPKPSRRGEPESGCLLKVGCTEPRCGGGQELGSLHWPCSWGLSWAGALEIKNWSLSRPAKDFLM